MNFSQIKKFCFLYLALLSVAAASDWLIAKVGKYTVTEYGLSQYVDFQELTEGKRPSKEDALNELIMNYAILNFGENEPNFHITESSIDRSIDMETNLTINKTSPDRAKAWKKVYDKYPEQMRMNLKVQRVKSIFSQVSQFYIKDDIIDISEDAKKDFYEKNKNSFMEPPEVGMMIIATALDPNLGIFEQAQIEEQMQEVFDKFEKTPDNEKKDFVLNIRKGFPSIDFTSFTTVVDTNTPYNLVQQKIPEMVIALAVQEKVVKVGVPVFVPNLIPVPDQNVNLYLILYVTNRKQAILMPYETVSGQIDSILRQKGNDNNIDEFILNKILSGEIFFQLLDDSYKKTTSVFVSDSTNETHTDPFAGLTNDNNLTRKKSETREKIEAGQTRDYSLENPQLEDPIDKALDEAEENTKKGDAK